MYVRKYTNKWARSQRENNGKEKSEQELENHNSHQVCVCFDKLIATISPWLEWLIKREISPPPMVSKMK